MKDFKILILMKDKVTDFLMGLGTSKLFNNK